MAAFSATCIFCEDIREEKSGQDTIVGTLPDNININVENAPPSEKAKALLSKLGVYVRMNFDVHGGEPKQVAAKLIDSNGRLIAETIWPDSVIAKAFADSLASDMPFVGLVFKVVAGPFPISQEGGKISMVAIVDGIEKVIGALNVIVSSASQPPAAQSPSVS